MPEPKFTKAMKIKVNNRDPRDLVWYPKLEQFHGQTGTVVDSEFWMTYYLPGEKEPTDVFNYTIDFGGVQQTNIPQMILQSADTVK